LEIGKADVDSKMGFSWGGVGGHKFVWNLIFFCRRKNGFSITKMFLIMIFLLCFFVVAFLRGGEFFDFFFVSVVALSFNLCFFKFFRE
jgi:hypothetical protein